MSEFGTGIKNIQAASIYEFNHGFRNYLDMKPAMLSNSLFSDFLKEHGLHVSISGSTRDIICLEFGYGSKCWSRKAKELKKELKALQVDPETKQEVLDKTQSELDKCLDMADQYDCSKEELRIKMYEDGVTVNWTYKNKKGEFVLDESIHYQMLYRTPGKAKKGTVMFIRDELFKEAQNFLRMGIELPKENAPIVEIGAYQSLITSSIVGKVQIDPKNILILKDVDSFFKTDVVTVYTDEERKCHAKKVKDYELCNTLFDGQALIDISIFPSWGEGYILLRHHFCKMAAFCTKIQLFFMDYFGDKYETATVTDMFGNEHLAKDIKLITTDNACKWLKFGVTYDYWCQKVNENGNNFGIVKTAHKSKLGDVQQMSYQMINALEIDRMDKIMETTEKYIASLKTDEEAFLNYLRDNANFSNDYDVLIALIEQDHDFVQSRYFKERRHNIIESYIKNVKLGKLIQNGDNLTIIGSPYAMLLHSVGEDVEKDDTFNTESRAIQCYTLRFDNNEYLAEFRSPFNSRNNLGYLHNVYHYKLGRYFKFGKQIIAVNMIHTDFQARNNGSDQDSDSLYVTNQPDVVACAKMCHENYPTIVNLIPKEKNTYDGSLRSFANVDNALGASQRSIGESSNLAQICLTYTYNFPEEQKYQDYVCILSVVA